MNLIRHPVTLALILAVLIAGCGANDAATSNSRSRRFQPATDTLPPDCGRLNVAGAHYGTEIRPTSGPPSTEVVLSGTTVRGEDGRWAPSDRLEAWWNTEIPASEVPGGRPIEDGPVIQLVRVDDMEKCRFEATFRVPDVEPGRYQVSVFAWEEDPTNGYGLFLPHHFTVTRDSPSP